MNIPLGKTPVSILQEIMVKKNIIPTYEVLPCSEGFGTHCPTFYCQGTADGVSAIGKGRTKKEAKHEAARLVLEQLKQMRPTGYSGMLANIPSLPPSKPFEAQAGDVPSSEWSIPCSKIELNAVGQLKDLCAEKKIPAPEFVLLSDIGPPHLRQFTMECKVGSLSATATDLTKKKAKQNAAMKMLERLQQALPEDIEELTITFSKDSDTLFEKYNELTKHSNKLINWGMKIAEYTNTIRDLMDEKNVSYNELWKIDNENRNMEENVQKLLEKLEVKYVTTFIDLENGKGVMAFTDTDTTPSFSFVAREISKEKAEENTLRQLYEHLKIMTK